MGDVSIAVTFAPEQIERANQLTSRRKIISGAWLEQRGPRGREVGAGSHCMYLIGHGGEGWSLILRPTGSLGRTSWCDRKTSLDAMWMAGL